ncbi:MAG: glutamine--fructose-6-phosphate transaminase (isomerizing) [Crocinitomicaceae bacterium]|nr:glutamine--fructose-6-phosphate transaminase (isomerizing) [Crocinitomicaceae bacterium]
MCGIVAYIGEKQAYPIVLNGLKRLEYRGYDSAGVAVLKNGNINTYKKEGKVSNLEDFVKDKDITGGIAIGHTRWATHGPPNDVNAHPHTSENGNVTLVHNGIIENYDSIRKELESKGYTFKSDTDTEVLCYLISDIKTNTGVKLGKAIRLALQQVVGAYAIVVMCEDEPHKIIVARKSSPLVVGIGKENDFYVASDATPIVEYTKQVVYLNDDEIAVLNKEKGMKLYNIDEVQKEPYVEELELHLEALEKGGYEHFMLKEIHEQPTSIQDCFRGRLNAKEGWVSLGGIKYYLNRIMNADRVVMVACGTSWHACLVGEYLFEDLARINVEVEYASEFRYRNPIINENDIVLAISQSGETADTLAALELAKSRGATILGICNVVGSSISRLTDAGSYTHAGPEIGVASTKAFTAQVTVLTIMAISLARRKGKLNEAKFRSILSSLEAIPKKVQAVLDKTEKIKKIAEKYKDAANALYLGRGSSFPVALEGALKLKEISYIHAEGYPAAEMKHGPIALIDEEMPVFVIATKGTSYEKVVSNIQEVKARKGKIVAIVTDGDEQVKAIADDIIEIPETNEHLVPLIATIPLQILSYYIAVMRGCNVDQPRNLAKSVTVE